MLSEDAERKMKLLFEAARKNKDFGNGRYARNICESAIRNLSLRVVEHTEVTCELLSTIIADDVEDKKLEVM